MPGWVRKVLIGVGALLLLLVSFLIFIQTPYGKRKIASYAQGYLLQTYNLKTSVTSLDYKLRPPLVIRLNGLKLYGGRDNSLDFLSSRSLEVVIPYSSLWSDNFVIRRLTLDSPDMNPENLPSLK